MSKRSLAPALFLAALLPTACAQQRPSRDVEAAISQLERREDIRLSTLRRYVEAMGGRLEMKVVFEEFSAVVDVAPSDKTGEK